VPADPTPGPESGQDPPPADATPPQADGTSTDAKSPAPTALTPIPAPPRRAPAAPARKPMSTRPAQRRPRCPAGPPPAGSACGAWRTPTPGRTRTARARPSTRGCRSGRSSVPSLASAPHGHMRPRRHPVSRCLTMITSSIRPGGVSFRDWKVRSTAAPGTIRTGGPLCSPQAAPPWVSAHLGRPGFVRNSPFPYSHPPRFRASCLF
jgi:hypothetical protein